MTRRNVVSRDGPPDVRRRMRRSKYVEVFFIINPFTLSSSSTVEEVRLGVAPFINWLRSPLIIQGTLAQVIADLDVAHSIRCIVKVRRRFHTTNIHFVGAFTQS